MDANQTVCTANEIFIKPNFAQAYLTPLLLIVRAGLPLKILLPMSAGGGGGGVLPYMGSTGYDCLWSPSHRVLLLPLLP